MDKVEFPGVFSFEVDSLNPDSIPLNYDINVSESKKMQEESIDILDPNLVKPVRSLLKVKKKIHFCPQSTWYGLDGNEQTKPLSNKYTLRYSLLNFKAKFFPVYLKRHYKINSMASNVASMASKHGKHGKQAWQASMASKHGKSNLIVAGLPVIV